MKYINKFCLAGLSAAIFVMLLMVGALLIPGDVFAQGRAPQTNAVSGKIPAILDIQINKAHSIDLPSVVAKVIIGNEGIADIHLDPKTPTKAFVMSRAVGTTNIFFMDKKGALVHKLEVRVTFDNQGMQQALDKLIPENNIEVSVFRDTVFITGRVRSAAESAKALSIIRNFATSDTKIVNMLSVRGSQQVVLQVRVAEIARTVRKSLSVSQDFATRIKNDKSITFNTTGVFPTTQTAYAAGTIITNLAGLGSASFSVLEQQGVVKTLAEPTLTAISGETATFLSGGEFAAPTGQDDSGTTYEYKEYGIRLSFTPVVIDENRINLKVSTELSGLDTTNATSLGTNISIPALTQKKTETTIDLPSGGSIMIAGLLEDNITDTVNGFPGLKDVPILGALFRSTEFQKDETELIITVTAYLVRPTGNKRLSLPSDGFAPASDIDFYLLGRLHREYTKQDREIGAKSLKGPFGYIME